VTACLRLRGPTSRAEHPALAFSSAGPDLAATLTCHHGTPPAPTAKIRIAAGGESNDGADALAPTARPDVPRVAVRTARPALDAAHGGQRPADRARVRRCRATPGAYRLLGVGRGGCVESAAYTDVARTTGTRGAHWTAGLVWAESLGDAADRAPQLWVHVAAAADTDAAPSARAPADRSAAATRS